MVGKLVKGIDLLIIGNWLLSRQCLLYKQPCITEGWSSTVTNDHA